MAKILLADDDRTLAANLKEWLVEAGYVVDLAYSVNDAASAIKTIEYDLVILDWEFPDGAGVTMVREYRDAGGVIPILMLTGRSDPKDLEQGLDSGADDYLIKPFNVTELGARMRALLRRPRAVTSDQIKVGRLVLFPQTQSLVNAGQTVELRHMEYLVFELFMRHPGKIFSPEKIIERIWNSDTDVSMHAVYSCIKRLRKKIDLPDQRESVLRTIPGSGYQLVDDL